MSFSLAQFYSANRRAFIWLILIGLVWLMSDFFALLFLTFVVSFVTLSATRLLKRYVPFYYRVCLVIVYVVFLGGVITFVSFVVPNVVREVNKFTGNLGQIQQTLTETKSKFFEQYPGWRRPFVGYLRGALDENSIKLIDGQLEVEARRLGLDPYEARRYLEKPNDSTWANTIRRYQAVEEELLLNSLLADKRAHLGDYVPRFIDLIYRTSATILLALLFSFLILIDIKRLTEQVHSLRVSRLQDFYEEVAQPLARFTQIVGRAIEVQGAIALVNTLLTAIGIILLGIPSVMMLSLIVFVCGFIPVLGTFISTTPIVLVALNNGGVELSLAVIILVSLVHLVEAYLLNPFIYGQHMRLNPVLVLIILFIGYHGFGVWGMVLGLPVTLYFLHDVFGVPVAWGQRTAKPVVSPAAASN